MNFINPAQGEDSLHLYKLTISTAKTNTSRQTQKEIKTQKDISIMALEFHFPRFLTVLLFVSFAPHLSIAGDITPTALIDQVCKNTKIYDFCVSTIYTDPNAKLFARTDLADFIFRLTDDKAEIFRSYLKAQSQNAAATKLCQSDYALVDDQIAKGLSDMNDDEYQNLKQYSAEMSKAVLHCHAALAPSLPALVKYNHLVKSVIDICLSVGSLFSSE